MQEINYINQLNHTVLLLQSKSILAKEFKS